MHSSIEYIANKSFSNLNYLSYLDLSYNNLKKLDLELNLNNVARIFLLGNQISEKSILNITLIYLMKIIK